MISIIKNVSLPPICKKEVYRYALCKSDDSLVEQLFDECVTLCANKIKTLACFDRFSITVCDKSVNFGKFSLQSDNLSTLLSSCNDAIIFCASIGLDIDREIAKYSKISPSKALMLQAIATERIESLCDKVCSIIQEQTSLFTTPRFSPGYGDLSLESQRLIFQMLSCEKNIGVTLNDSLLMSPSKSVTAIVGLTRQKVMKTNKCNLCATKCDYWRTK